MTREEYDIKVTFLKQNYSKWLSEINREYALSNNPVKIGDIVTDSYHSIRVERILFTIPWGDIVPSCIYEGTQYTKSGKPSSIQNDRRLSQVCLKAINGVPYTKETK